MLETPRLSAEADRNEDDKERRSLVVGGVLWFPRPRDDDAQFLHQLSPGSVFIRFSCLRFPSWEFPQPAVPLVRRPLAYEELLTPTRDAGDNTDQVIDAHPAARSTENSLKSLALSGTSSVQVMLIGRSPSTSSAESIRSGPQALNGVSGFGLTKS